jgi:hypothetical protein
VVFATVELETDEFKKFMKRNSMSKNSLPSERLKESLSSYSSLLSCVNAFHPFIFFPSGVLCLGVLVSSTSFGESHTREQLTGQALIDKMQAVGSEPICT